MSGIFGIFNLDKRPVMRECLHHMQNAMRDWGPNGSSIWSQSSIGLGHLMMFNTPESITETQPLHHSTSQISLTCSARLDNRADLFRKLSVPVAETRNITDSILILMAYEKWGVDCPEHLIGDWAFAVWDARKQQLFIARDHFGVTSLYYLQNQQTFLFASSIKGLLALPDITYSLNPIGLAHRFPNIPRNDTTCYNNVYRLTPGQSLIITANKTIRQQYWHPQQAPEVRYQTDEQYVEAFNEIFLEAVRCRLRTYRPVGSMLSGGLDSSSIAIVAAKILAQNNQRLPTFSSVPLYQTASTTSALQFGDESPFINEICNTAGTIDSHLINADNTTPLTGIKRILEIMQQPDFGSGNMYWIIALLETAQHQGIGTLLHGDMGNFTLSWAGNRNQFLLSLLKEGRWSSYIKEINAWHQLNHTNKVATFKNQLIKSLMPRIIQGHLKGQVPNKRFNILNNHFVEKTVLPHQKDQIRTNPLKHVASPHREIYAAYNSGLCTTISEIGAAFGMEIRSPAIDKRLLEFCLGIPQNQYTRNGHTRLLIRRAMSGVLPDGVLWNNRRGKQAADIPQRLIANKSEIDSFFQTLQQSSTAGQYLNLDYLTEVFKNSLNESELSPASSQQSAAVLTGLNIGLFLQRFDNQSS